MFFREPGALQGHEVPVATTNALNEKQKYCWAKTKIVPVAGRK